MTTAKPPARYGAMGGARAGGFATAELHHHQGHDLPPSSDVSGAGRTGIRPDAEVTIPMPHSAVMLASLHFLISCD